jgi:hypothetical protein
LIPVTPQPEPNGFEIRVRTPGRAFLRRVLRPTGEQFRNANYWNRCLPKLREAYAAVCAYSSVWIATGGSVDHFWPKSLRPDLAYEWENYRLALEIVNNNKGESTDILDPFAIQPGWFALDFSNFFVKPNDGLPEEVEVGVLRTIEILKLNKEDPFLKLRFLVVKEYAEGHFSLDFLRRRYPFIASELERQDLAKSIKGRRFS